MMKKSITALIMIFAGIAEAFSQTKLVVHFRGYELDPKDSIYRDDLRTFNDDFVKKLDELNKGNENLKIIPTYLEPGKIPESEADYIIRGIIKLRMSDMYDIRTELFDLKGKESRDFPTPREPVHFNLIREIIRKHAQEIYKRFEPIISIEKSEDIPLPLTESENKNFTVYTGGLSLFIEKPLLFTLLDSFRFDVLETYPAILGAGLRYNSAGDLPLQWYIHLSYAGGSTTDSETAYLKDTALHFFSLTSGLNLQYFINRIAAPYINLGAGYIHLFEYASDGKDSAVLNFPGMILEVGVGSRFYLNQHFALNALVNWNLILPLMLMDIKFSLGASYLFLGKENIVKR